MNNTASFPTRFTAPATRRQPIAVLLVDDDRDDQFLFREKLREVQGQRFDVTCASTYEEGLEALKSSRFDVCFFDYFLDAYTGFDLLHQAKAMHLDTPIVLLTTAGDLEMDRKAQDMGATDYLVKRGMSSEGLERCIRYAIRRAATLRELRDSEERYRGLFQASIDAICLLDAEGEFTDANHTALELFGYNRADFLQKKITELFENVEDASQMAQLLSQRQNVRDFEAPMLTAEGERRFCIVACTCHTQTNGDQVFFQVILHDVTRRKKAEAELLAAEKMAATSRLMRLLGHEIRNPLTNIDLSLSQLEAENQDEELDDYIDIIKRNSKRIGQLLVDLLQSANPGRLDFRPCMPQDLMDETLVLAADRIALKGIEVHKDYQLPGVPIQADPEKLKMALLNVVLNAVEIMEPGQGVLHLSTRIHDGDCAISIRDNGPGIAREHQGRIFEPYFSQKTNGLGLGLAGSQSIAQLHKGRIEVRSELGKGAEFTFHLPVIS